MNIIRLQVGWEGTFGALTVEFREQAKKREKE
jgi:hypothetical protein